MTKYRELDPRIFNEDSSSSTWINLGLWTRDVAGVVGFATSKPSGGLALGGEEDMRYVEACESMARAVGMMAGIQKGDAVLDIGCGFGDSLALWRTEFNCDRAVGVNVTKSECQAAREKLKDIENVQVIHMDGLAFVRTVKQTETFDVALSLDALYHINTRATFLDALRECKDFKPKALGRKRIFAEIGTFGAVDLIPKGESFSFWSVFKTAPIRLLGLVVISFMGGVPLRNLLYTAECVVDQLQSPPGTVTLEGCVDVTHLVFEPFGLHMSAKARVAWKAGKLASAMSIQAAAWFMRAMHRCGLVQVALYAVSFQDE